MTSLDGATPFVAALGHVLEQAAPVVCQHLTLPDGRAFHHGFIRRRWSRGVSGWIVGRLLNLDGGRAGNAEGRFELRNEIVEDGSRGTVMLWHRTHYSNSKPVSGIGLLRWAPSRHVLIDSIGKRSWLEVELVPTVEDRTVVMTSRRQWLRIGRVRLPLPRALFGTAQTREWEEPDGRLGLNLTLRHTLLGPYAGYEAVLTPGERR